METIIKARGIWINDSFEKRSSSAKLACSKKSKEAKQASSFANMWDKPKEELDKIKDRAYKARESKRKETNVKISEGVKKSWDGITPENKTARVKSALNHSAKEYILINNTMQFFHSSWEAGCANVFIQLGIEYETQKIFQLGKNRYSADFYLPHENIVIEVKGMPKAWKRWHEITLPRINKYWDRDIKLFVVSFNPILKYSTLDQFLNDMTLIVLT